MHEPADGSDETGRRPPGSLDPRTSAVIAVGGAAGAGLRWTVGEVVGPAGDWPWPILVVNIAGCAVLGWLVANRAHLSDRAFAAAALGFCGALTTFSAFAVDLAVMARDDRPALFAGYLLVSFVSGTVAYIAGRRIGLRRAPLATP